MIWKTACRAAALVACVCSASVAGAVPIELDLVSGLDSNLNGANPPFDTYDEDGFRLQMDRPGDHMDRNFIGDIATHNGPTNLDDVSMTLSFGGEAFNLLEVDLAGFLNGASSISVTGSNGVAQVLSLLGPNTTFGLFNITFATFDIDQDGGTQSFGLNSLLVEAVPVPATLPLFGAGVLMLGVIGWRRRHI